MTFDAPTLLQDADSLNHLTDTRLLGRVVARVLRALILEVIRLRKAG